MGVEKIDVKQNIELLYIPKNTDLKQTIVLFW